MSRCIDLSTCHPLVRQRVLNIFDGITDYFPIPEKITTRRLNAILEWKTIDAARRQHEQFWEPKFAKLFNGVGNVVSQTYKETGGNLEVTIRAVDRALTVPFERMMNALHLEVEPEFIRTAPEQVLRKADEWDTVEVYDLPELVEWNRNTTATKVTQVTLSTKQGIRELVDRSLRNGASITDIVAALDSSYMFGRSRAHVIARTEVISSANAASHWSVKKFMPMDAGGTKDWLSTGDDRMRDSHRTAGTSQKDIPFEKPFEVGGSQLMFPGDGSLNASAKEIIQCRCTCLYHLPKYDELRNLRKPTPRRKPSPIRAVPKPKPTQAQPGGTVKPRTSAEHDAAVQAEVTDLENQIEEILRNKTARNRTLAQYDEAIEELSRKLAKEPLQFSETAISIKQQIRTLQFQRKELVLNTSWDVRQLMELPLDQQGTFKFKATLSKAGKEKAQAAAEWISKNSRAGAEWQRTERLVDWVPKGREQRAFANGRSIYVTPRNEVDVYVHEFGHTIDFHSPRYLNSSVKHLEDRTKGEVASKLKNLFPGHGYHDYEIAKKDKFQDWYTGKIYVDQRGNWYGTEVLSMGMQQMFNNPAKLFLEDRELWRYVMTILREGKRPWP